MSLPDGALGRILLRLPNWLGDALMARPLAHALRAAHPGARIVALGPASILDLLEREQVWDESRAWPPAGQRDRFLQEQGWDAALVLPPSFSSAWHAWQAGARRRIGFSGEARSWLLTTAVRREPRGNRHLSREYLDLGSCLGAGEVGGILPVLCVPALSGALQELATGPFAVLAPGAIHGPAKRWPVERFAALARELIARGLRVLACGGKHDADSCAALAKAVGGGTLSVAGRTSLGEQAALCAEAALVVSNDSGLAHLSGAVGAPTIAIFGSTSSAWTAPLGARVRVVQRPPVCSPCFARTCRIGYACLDAVSVSRVLRAAEALEVTGMGVGS